MLGVRKGAMELGVGLLAHCHREMVDCLKLIVRQRQVIKKGRSDGPCRSLEAVRACFISGTGGGTNLASAIVALGEPI